MNNNKDNILYLIERGIIKGMKEGISPSEYLVTTKQFVTMIIRSSKGNLEPTCDELSSGYIDYALNQGIIQDYDITNINNLIERRSAARIVHQTLLKEFTERDEEDWSAASQLIDLYSCRICVMHIAQVYVKGIMIGRKDNVFDMKGNITLNEAAAIVVRMLDKNRRLPQIKHQDAKCKRIQPNQAWGIMSNNSRTILMDVRTYEEYKQGHIEGSLCLPLYVLIDNPFSVSVRKDIPIIIYCQKGYKSSLAAQVLIDAGFSKIYTIPGVEQYQYSLIK